MLNGLVWAPPGAQIVDHWSVSGRDRRKRPAVVILYTLPTAQVYALRVELPRAAWKWDAAGWKDGAR